MISKYIHYINFPAMLLWAACLIALVLAVRAPMRGAQLKGLRFIKPFLVILLVRLILFDNMASWGCYFKILSPADIGWRQKDVIIHEVKRSFKWPAQEIKYLAVGSSQTGAVYKRYADKNSDFRTFVLAGLGPMDMYLYRDYIARYSPEYILLYLSEFDIAREPDLNLAKIAPYQKQALIQLFPDLRAIARKYNKGMALQEMIVGEFLPEYKYSFIFKGMTYKLFQKKAPLYERGDKEPEGILQRHLWNLQTNLDEGAIPLNMKFLKRFLSFCEKNDFKVVIVEGQYNPLGYYERNLELNEYVREEVISVVKSYKNVQFLPRTSLPSLAPEDYEDAYHIKASKSEDMARNIIKLVQ